ncbi:MAG: VWA domain-containing protein [Actinomycetota bacterium]|nr:VWA domain-containing protein [Actinomycetota bacterium]
MGSWDGGPADPGQRRPSPGLRGEPLEPAGMAPRLLEFADELRQEGMTLGTSELLDAFEALGSVSWTEREAFREALATTLAKSQEDRRVLDLVFDRFFFRVSERQAAGRGLKEGGMGEGGAERIDLEELRARIREALRAGSDGELRDLARLAIAAFGRQGEGSGVIGVDVQRIRRTLGLKGEARTAALPDPHSVPRERLRDFEGHIRRELERALIEQTGELPPAKPLRELDRALPTGPAQDLAAVHRVVAQLRRRLATQGREQRGRRRSAVVDVRRTMRHSLQTGGVPLELRFRPRRPRRPELFVLCDVSTSVTSASAFFLCVLHALHDSFRRLRSFVFVERISEVTDVFERERSFAGVSRAIAGEAGVADVSGYTDYGRVWVEFLEQVVDELDPRSTVIVLGDARTNGREPHANVFGQVAERAGRTFWMNPEPRLYWNYGDSVMAAYERYCTGAFECWTTKQLEGVVNALTDLRPTPTLRPRS